MSMRPDTRQERYPSPAARYPGVRAATERLAAGLSAEDCAVQSMPDASPVEVAPRAHHLVLRDLRARAARAAATAPFDPAFRVLFNSYYNGVGEQHPRPQRGLLSRPGAGRGARLSRATSTRRMRALLGRRRAPTRSRATLVELGLHHEQQHQELILTDVKHLLSRNPLQPAYRKPWPLTPIAGARARAGSPATAGLREIGHARRRLLLRQRDAAPPRLARRRSSSPRAR